MEDEARKVYHFPLADVLPTAAAGADYMHLDDPQHPAYIFMVRKLRELSEPGREAVGCYKLFTVEGLDIHEGNIRLDGQTLHLERKVCGYLRGATMAALFLCTAGAVFTTQYREYNNRGDYLEAYITDAIGSLTVENAMDKIEWLLSHDMEAQGLHTSNRYSPGYCNWPLAEQKLLFQLVGDQPTGITLSDSCLMYPTKSVSGIIGVGPRLRHQAYGCLICHNKNCIYRRIVQKDK